MSLCKKHKKDYDITIVYGYETIESYYNIFEEYLNNNNHLIIFTGYSKMRSSVF